MDTSFKSVRLRLGSAERVERGAAQHSRVRKVCGCPRDLVEEE